ncbi:hypothetical protein TREES_T100011973 [Tupaia chinensis]|uniref:Uncharacterized protein n=1 Tax=Tupaia chinensis TaxID=246437 RepID=L9KPZ0_TUPCH|nr:hypothetical protein TREES_T100011973 [Tupaia chinensis]
MGFSPSGLSCPGQEKSKHMTELILDLGFEEQRGRKGEQDSRGLWQVELKPWAMDYSLCSIMKQHPIACVIMAQPEIICLNGKNRCSLIVLLSEFMVKRKLKSGQSFPWPV